LILRLDGRSSSPLALRGYKKHLAGRLGSVIDVARYADSVGGCDLRQLSGRTASLIMFRSGDDVCGIVSCRLHSSLQVGSVVTVKVSGVDYIEYAVC
jgi:hypothetical protein